MFRSSGSDERRAPEGEDGWTGLDEELGRVRAVPVEAEEEAADVGAAALEPDGALDLRAARRRRDEDEDQEDAWGDAEDEEADELDEEEEEFSEEEELKEEEDEFDELGEEGDEDE